MTGVLVITLAALLILMSRTVTFPAIWHLSPQGTPDTEVYHGLLCMGLGSNLEHQVYRLKAMQSRRD